MICFPSLLLFIWRRVIMPQAQHHVSAATTWMGYQIRIPIKITYFLSFCPSLSKAMFVTAEPPVLCNVFCFSSCQLSIQFNSVQIISPCPYSFQYCINDSKISSFEFSSVLSSVDLPKLVIPAWILIQKLLSFPHAVEQAPSRNELFIKLASIYRRRAWENLFRYLCRSFLR